MKYPRITIFVLAAAMSTGALAKGGHDDDDANSQIRIAALEAIADSRNTTLIPRIEALIYDHQLEVRIAAIEALASHEDAAATPALASLLSDPNAQVKHHAVNALDEIGGELAMNYLQQARYDSDNNIRANARVILEENGIVVID